MNNSHHHRRTRTMDRRVRPRTNWSEVCGCHRRVGGLNPLWLSAARNPPPTRRFFKFLEESKCFSLSASLPNNSPSTLIFDRARFPKARFGAGFSVAMLSAAPFNSRRCEGEG
jgi:hypothetical protein